MDQELKELLIRLFVSEEPFFGSEEKCTIDRADIEALRDWYRRELKKAGAT